MKWKRYTYLSDSGARLLLRAPASWVIEYEPPYVETDDAGCGYLSFLPPVYPLRQRRAPSFWLSAHRDTSRPNADREAVEACARPYAGVKNGQAVALEALPGGRYLRCRRHISDDALSREQMLWCFWYLYQPMPDALCYAIIGFRDRAALYEGKNDISTGQAQMLSALEPEIRAAVFLP